MQLKDIMTPNPECIRPDATLQEAARRMRDLDVGPLPVCGDDDRLAGMITDRDITVRAVAEGKDPTTTRVRESRRAAGPMATGRAGETGRRLPRRLPCALRSAGRDRLGAASGGDR